MAETLTSASQADKGQSRAKRSESAGDQLQKREMVFIPYEGFAPSLSARKEQLRHSLAQRTQAATVDPVEESSFFDALLGTSMLNPDVEWHAAIMSDPRFSYSANTETRSRIASRLQRTYGNTHMQRVVDIAQEQEANPLSETEIAFGRDVNNVVMRETASQIQRNCRPGHRGPPMVMWRLAGSGENYHSLFRGFPTDRAGELESQIRPGEALHATIRSIMISRDIMQMREQLGPGEIIFHSVESIYSFSGGHLQERRQTNGQTATSDNSSARQGEIHIAIARRAGGTARNVIIHELFHGFESTEMPPARRGRGGGRRAVTRRLPVHPRDLVDAMRDPQHGLAAQMRWPGSWDHPYRFGWLQDPCNGTGQWWHLDMPALWQPLNWRRGANDQSWMRERDANLAFIPGQASAHESEAVRAVCRNLIRIKRDHLYESGFRCTRLQAQDNPEEDITTAFEQYHTNQRDLASYYPKRHELLSIYLHWPR